MFMFYYLINNNFINIILDYIYVYEVLNWFFFYEREKLMFVCFLYLFKNFVDMNNLFIFVKLYD